MRSSVLWRVSKSAGGTGFSWRFHAAEPDSLGLDGLPAGRLSQDGRDAIIAAWTARLCSTPGAIEWFAEIAVPA